jgi:hypothetical protein
MAKTIEGFNYLTGKAVTATRKEWTEIAKACVAKHGYIRVHDGETFLHSANGLIEAEVYGYLGKVNGGSDAAHHD